MTHWPISISGPAAALLSIHYALSRLQQSGRQYALDANVLWIREAKTREKTVVCVATYHDDVVARPPSAAELSRRPHAAILSHALVRQIAPRCD